MAQEGSLPPSRSSSCSATDDFGYNDQSDSGAHAPTQASNSTGRSSIKRSRTRVKQEMLEEDNILFSSPEARPGVCGCGLSGTRKVQRCSKYCCRGLRMGRWAIGVSIASRAFVSTDQFRISNAFDDSELSGPADNDNNGTSSSYSRNATPEPVSETCQWLDSDVTSTRVSGSIHVNHSLRLNGYDMVHGFPGLWPIVEEPWGFLVDLSDPRYNIEKSDGSLISVDGLIKNMV